MNSLQRKFYKFLIRSNIFQCPICGGKNHSSYNRPCRECRRKIKFISDNYCYSCGGELDGALAICSKCLREKKRQFLQAVSLLPYQQFNRELILSFKNGGKIELATFFARLAVSKLKRLEIDFDIVLAVPLHWSKKQRRGYNQSEFLAELIAEGMRKPFALRAIKRVKKGKQQKQLNSVERHKNLKNAFLADPKIVKGKKVLLIDDIFTTGATVDNVSIALKKAGAIAITVMTIARA